MKRWAWGLAAAGAFGFCAAAFLLRPVEGPARDLSLAGDATRGQYLLRLGGCVACHTGAQTGSAFLAGGMPLKTPFGSFVPPNITPDKTAGIGNWTLADFSRAMSDGIGPQGQHYYPAFPYENYTLMSDGEIADLWAALQAVEPVAQAEAASDIPFPFNIRLAMAGWKNLFFKPGRFEPEPDRSAQWNRGKYLVNGPAHCVACHTPRNFLGASEAGQALKGSPEGSIAGKVPPIDKDSLSALGYDHAILVDVLNGGVTPEYDVPGGAMSEVIFEGTVYWTDEDRNAVASYLLGE